MLSKEDAAMKFVMIFAMKLAMKLTSWPGSQSSQRGIGVVMVRKCDSDTVRAAGEGSRQYMMSINKYCQNTVCVEAYLSRKT